MIKIAVSGCNGRMGGRIKKLVEDDPDLELAGAFDINDDACSAIERCDVLIEFTTPDATVKNLAIARDLGKAVVIGTTGIGEEGVNRIKDAAKDIAVVFSPNMSVGVNLLFKLVGEAGTALGKDFSASVSEAHHVHKKDAPSGTAKKLHSILTYSKKCGKDDIKVESQRIGEVVGDHTVVLDGKEETLTLIHHAKSRDVFVRGALIAAKFVAGKDKGLFTMNEVLGI